jgi:hypothetical protein
VRGSVIQRVQPFRSRRRRYAGFALLFVFSAIVGATITAGALAHIDYYSVTVYAQGATVPPGGTRETAGFNTRTENAACRENNSGQNAVFYFDTSYTEYHSGVVWTNCATQAWVYMFDNGYFKSYCENAGTVDHLMTCWSWNYDTTPGPHV